MERTAFSSTKNHDLYHECRDVKSITTQGLNTISNYPLKYCDA